jgi:hypothetical protein
MERSDARRAGDEAEFVDRAIDDDEVSPREQLLLDRKELHSSGSRSTTPRVSPTTGK